MRAIVLLSFSLSVTLTFDYSAFQNLRFSHSTLGQLRVSQQRFPLLTPVSEPDNMVFVVPTSAQLKDIEAILNKQIGKRRKRQTLSSLNEMKQTVKNFLVQEFGNEISVPPAPPSANNLPFTSFGSTSDFEFIWLPKKTYYQFLGAYFKKLQNIFTGKNWFPANELQGGPNNSDDLKC